MTVHFERDEFFLVFLFIVFCIYSMFNFPIQTNDFVRGKMTDKDGEIPLYGEILAGGCVSCLIVNLPTHCNGT